MQQCDLLSVLLQRVPEGDVDAFQRLCTAANITRERAGYIANDIARSYPDLTVHSGSHIDALCQLAPRIAGEGFISNPAEGFVLAASFCIHDLGNGIVAYARGEDELRETIEWKDAYSLEIRSALGRPPTQEELASPDEKVAYRILPAVLRRLHAQQAESLSTEPFHHDGDSHYLIDDSELRRYFGPIIGIIAQSHNWGSDELSKRVLPRRVTALPWMPHHWTVDTLKIAVLLRVTDAAHLDSRRAPGFLYAIRKPEGESDFHWRFQERLGQPIIGDGRIEFTSTRPFVADEAPSWFLCYDALRLLDRELQDAESLLAELGLPRLEPRRVAGIHSPSTLTHYIKVEGWEPVDCPIKVSDAASLVETLGGKALYGDEPNVPLRELIQNATDAVRARRILEDRHPSWGEVIVTSGNDEHGEWVEVADSGVGMSRRVVSSELLDFGKSLWSSNRVAEELPGLVSTTYESTGQFGIGFFSVFLWGDRVRVSTCRFEEAARSTLVLEIAGGVYSRPLLRPATKEEEIRSGGTRIRVWLTDPARMPWMESGYRPDKLRNFLERHPRMAAAWEKRKRHNTFLKICGQIAPTLDVRLLAGRGYPLSVVVEANDWETTEAEILGGRIPHIWRTLEGSLTTLCDENGEVIGRVRVAGSRSIGGIVTVGGLLASEVVGLDGMLIGRTLVAARNKAVPFAQKSHFEQWWQVEKKRVRSLSGEEQANCAGRLASLGCDIGEIVVGYAEDHRWLTFEQVVELACGFDRLFLIDRIVPEWAQDDETFRPETLSITAPSLDERVYLGDPTPGRFGLLASRGDWGGWNSLSSLLIESMAERWNLPSADVRSYSEIEGHADFSIEEEGLSIDYVYTLILKNDRF